MGKVITNPKEVKIMEIDGTIDVSLHYGLTSEEYPDIHIRKGITIESFTPPEQAVIAQIVAWRDVKINEHEGL